MKFIRSKLMKIDFGKDEIEKERFRIKDFRVSVFFFQN